MPFKKTGKVVKVTKVCQQCGKEYEVWAYKQSESKYCSNKCKFKNTIPKFRQIRNILDEESYVIKICENVLCGKKFRVIKSLEDQKYSVKNVITKLYLKIYK